MEGKSCVDVSESHDVSYIYRQCIHGCCSYRIAGRQSGIDDEHIGRRPGRVCLGRSDKLDNCKTVALKRKRLTSGVAASKTGRDGNLADRFYKVTIAIAN
jgi:hypothetical protein